MNWVKPQGAPITATVSYEPGLSNVGVGIAGQHFDYLVPRISMEEIVPGVYQATIYATIYGAPGDYFVVFDNDGDDWQWEHLTLTASVYLPGEEEPEPEPVTAFASPEDVEALLGRTFSEQETGRVQRLLELVAVEIAGAVGKPEEWIDTVDPIPPALRTLSIGVARRMLANPEGAQSVMEQLGSYQHSASFSREAVGLTLSEDEVLKARRAVYGRNSASARVKSVAHDVADLIPPRLP